MAGEPIPLPDSPREEFLEHLAFAVLNCHGMYVDHNLIEREQGQDILELDAVATDFGETPPSSRLIECKSGTFGFADLFKVVGWLRYLNFDAGVLVGTVPSAGTKDTVFRSRAKDMGVEVVLVDSAERAVESFDSVFGPAEVDPIDLQAWRYAYWIERRLLERLRVLRRTVPNVERYDRLQQYYDQLNSGIFYKRNLLERIEALYDTFRRFPHVTAKCGNEMLGRPFAEDVHTLDANLFGDTFYQCAYNDVQLSCLVEQRARLAILKTGIEYKLLERAGVADDRTDRTTSFLGLNLDRYNLLPSTFRSGLDRIDRDPFVHRYPAFWQWFQYVFGGFILQEREEEEFALLSAKTGVPVDEVPRALDAYNQLFPCEDGWFVDVTNARIRRMRFQCVPFEGLGAHYRKKRYSKDGRYQGIGLSSRFGVNDLGRWNDLAYAVLRG